MQIALLALVAGAWAMAACPPKTGEDSAANATDTIIRQNSTATRDTIIKYRARRDTIIKHANVVSDECKKVPRPPECPPLYKALKADTIIK